MALPTDTPSIIRRVGAFALDYFLIVCYLAILVAVGSLLARSPAGDGWRTLMSSPERADFIAFSTAIMPVIIYFTVLESSARGATWGKHRMRLCVVRVGDGQLGLGRALVRSVVKFLPWQLAHTCLFHIPGWPSDPQEPPLWVAVGMALVWLLVGFYIVTLAVRSDRRTPYDWIAGSRVVGTETNDAG